MSLVIKLVALVVREVQDELRKMETLVLEEGVRYDPASTTAAVTERAVPHDHDTRPPVGFG